MHKLQPKHTILSEEETQKILEQFNISKAQLPKIFQSDPALPEGSQMGDVVKIERREGKEANIYYRVIV